jgi:hypothetical protein
MCFASFRIEVQHHGGVAALNRGRDVSCRTLVAKFIHNFLKLIQCGAIILGNKIVRPEATRGIFSSGVARIYPVAHQLSGSPLGGVLV